jgi:hypothetical protein
MAAKPDFPANGTYQNPAVARNQLPAQHYSRLSAARKFAGRSEVCQRPMRLLRSWSIFQSIARVFRKKSWRSNRPFPPNCGRDHHRNLSDIQFAACPAWHFSWRCLRRQCLVDDVSQGCDAAPATWTAAKTFVDGARGAWAGPAVDDILDICVGQDIARTNDH